VHSEFRFFGLLLLSQRNHLKEAQKLLTFK
jgi:hypothetical protein